MSGTTPTITSTQILLQQKRYEQVFGERLDFSGIQVPPVLPGFDRLLVMAQGFGPNRYFEACEKKFPCWRYLQDLDKGDHERVWDKTYAIWVRGRREADEDLKNTSANQIQQQGIPTETTAERLWHGLDWFLEKRGQLDVENWTLCAGSRGSDGDVPDVNWYGGRLRVDCCGPAYADPRLRARAVVSLAA